MCGKLLTAESMKSILETFRNQTLNISTYLWAYIDHVHVNTLKVMIFSAILVSFIWYLLRFLFYIYKYIHI